MDSIVPMMSNWGTNDYNEVLSTAIALGNLGRFTLLPNIGWGAKRLVYKVEYTRLQKILLFVNDLLKVKTFTL